MNRRDLLTALAVTALLPKGSNAESSHVQFFKRDLPLCMDLRDAPLPLALELLLGAYGLKAQVESADTGFVTLKTTDQPLEMNIDLIKRSARNHLELKVDNGVYTFAVGPQRIDPIPWQDRFMMALNYKEEKKVPLPIAPRTVLDISRRVCGMLSTRGEGSDEYVCHAAILETVEPDNSLRARIVRVGDRVASGLPNTPDLRVAELSPKGTVLETTEGDIRFLVRLASTGAPYPRVRPVPRQAPAGTSVRPMEPISPMMPISRPMPDVKPIPGMRTAPKPKVKPAA